MISEDHVTLKIYCFDQNPTDPKQQFIKSNLTRAVKLNSNFVLKYDQYSHNFSQGKKSFWPQEGAKYY